MSLYEYDYTKEVAIDRLTLEIQESDITIALDHIAADGTDVAIFFKDDLDTQETLLDTIVSDHVPTPLPANKVQDIDIVASNVDVPIKDHDLADRTGKNVYKYATCYDVDASKDECHFLTSFADYLYLCGGGYQILPKLFKSGVEFIQKPEHGDTVSFDLVDIDNILGHGKTASISKVARASNVATVTTAADHSFEVGERVHVDANDDTFDEMEAEVQSVADSTHFTYNQTGDDVVEKDATGDVGKIVVLAQFVPGDYIGPDSAWELVTPDGKLVPPGVFLRARITSNGSDDYHVYSWYNMRTYPG